MEGESQNQPGGFTPDYHLVIKLNRERLLQRLPKKPEVKKWPENRPSGRQTFTTWEHLSIGPLLAHLARPQLFRSCIWSASDYSQRQQGPANRFLGGTGGTRCGGRDGTGMHPADWHDDEEMRHEISGSQGT
ncbi:hypothetical protein CSPX01_10684 [Colletotrichum filicis]|nr:hypothetical protein CSPX01_10684 [Colletotrichum filicis]